MAATSEIREIETHATLVESQETVEKLQVLRAELAEYEKMVGQLNQMIKEIESGSSASVSELASDDQVVTPWKAECGEKGFQYQRLIEKFGVQPIDDALIARFEQVTGKPVHPWIRRGIFFAHRQLDEILNDYEAGKPIFLYTGRGPTSEALHLGHMVPFIFTKWLHDVFENSILVIQMADDEKFYFKDLTFEEVYRLGFENAKDIIACGFDPKRTFIFSNRDYDVLQAPHKLIHDMFKHVSVHHLKKVFGLEDSGCVGQFVWPIYQTAAAYSQFFGPIFGVQKVRCLVAYAIDQDPYFRVGRELAERQDMDLYKPCSIITQFLPALEGKAKMSSTATGNQPPTTIFMTDDPSQVKDKIKKYAFSGGRDTAKEQREFGANLEVDISYQWLRYFEYDDERLAQIGADYASGKMLTSQIKGILADKIIEMMTVHQAARAQVTEETVKYFYSLEKFQTSQ